MPILFICWFPLCVCCMKKHRHFGFLSFMPSIESQHSLLGAAAFPVANSKQLTTCWKSLLHSSFRFSSSAPAKHNSPTKTTTTTTPFPPFIFFFFFFFFLPFYLFLLGCYYDYYYYYYYKERRGREDHPPIHATSAPLYLIRRLRCWGLKIRAHLWSSWPRLKLPVPVAFCSRVREVIAPLLGPNRVSVLRTRVPLLLHARDFTGVGPLYINGSDPLQPYYYYYYSFLLLPSRAVAAGSWRFQVMGMVGGPTATFKIPFFVLTI